MQHCGAVTLSQMRCQPLLIRRAVLINPRNRPLGRPFLFTCLTSCRVLLAKAQNVAGFYSPARHIRAAFFCSWARASVADPLATSFNRRGEDVSCLIPVERFESDACAQKSPIETALWSRTKDAGAGQGGRSGLPALCPGRTWNNGQGGYAEAEEHASHAV